MTTNATVAGTAVVVYAKDIAKVAEFYRRTLDIAVGERTEDFIVLIGDGVELSVVRIPARLAETISITTPPVLRKNTAVKCSFFVPSLDTVRAAAVATGGGLGPPESAWSWRGILHLNGFDPEGNVVQFRSVAT